MTIEKKINYDEAITKEKFLADIRQRYEKAKEKGFKGDLREFILKIKHIGFVKGGPVKPNGMTTLSTDQWLDLLDPGGWASEEDKPMKVSYKFGATSQKEEDLIGGHVDEWMNEISRGELDPSISFMQYLDMILGRQGINRGGIVSVVPTL
tara:strand:- start:20 stop:472 length:453 start_codon:yes stop_codon:yes gene_type:complete